MTVSILPQQININVHHRRRCRKQRLSIATRFDGKFKYHFYAVVHKTFNTYVEIIKDYKYKYGYIAIV